MNTVEESDKISKVSDMDKMEMEKLFSKTRKRLNDRLKEYAEGYGSEQKQE